MALPAQAIEKMIREPSRSQGAYRQLMLLGLGLFVLVVVIYAGIRFGYQAYLKSSVEKLTVQKDEMSAAVPAEAQAETAAFYSQLVNLRTLLGSHSRVSPAFALLERSISPDIYYTRMNVNVTTNEMALAGAAKSLSAIAAQAALLERQPEVSRVNFSNAGTQTGGTWQFSMTVFLNPNTLRPTTAAVPVPPPISTTTPAGTGNSTSTQ